MNIQFFTAGILSLLAAFVHSFTGEYWIFPHLQGSTLPHTPFGDANVTKRILRVVWHFVTVDFLVSAIGLIVLATSGLTGSPKVTARMISLHYAGYVVVGLLLAIRGVKGLIRAPQIIVFAAIAILAWWGAT
jgi:hypothetical protein